MDKNQQPYEASPRLPPQSGPLSTTRVSPHSNPSPSPFDSKYETTYPHPRDTGNKMQNEGYSFTLSQQRPPYKAELLSLMSQTLETLPERRTFSSLTTDDFEILLEGGERGEIFINDKTISNEMRDFKISDDFWSGLQVARQVMSRVKETGVRYVIGHFLIHATLIARQMFKDERLIVHSEHEVKAFLNE